MLGITERGGRVAAAGKDGKSRASLGITEYGGLVQAYGEDGLPIVSLGVDENGGLVTIYRWGKSVERAQLNLNNFGNGEVSSWKWDNVKSQWQKLGNLR